MRLKLEEARQCLMACIESLAVQRPDLGAVFSQMGVALVALNQHCTLSHARVRKQIDTIMDWRREHGVVVPEDYQAVRELRRRVIELHDAIPLRIAATATAIE